MPDKELLGLLSLIVTFMGYAPYVVAVLLGKKKPHAFSWLIWGLVISITFVAQYTDHAGAGSWATGLSAVSCLGIGILALFKGEKNITRSDWFVFIATLSAIPLWLITRDPLWSVILVTSMDAAAYYPTYRKSYIKPHEEAVFKFALAAVKYALSLMALENYTAVTLIYPITSLILESAIVVMLLWRRHVLSVN